MRKNKVEKRVRDGMINADVTKKYLDMMEEMVKADYSDKTKWLRKIIEEEYKRRGLDTK